MPENKEQLIKNIEMSTALDLIDLVEYSDGSVISKTLCGKPHINITLFAFDKGEEISAHTSPGDALVQVFDGSATVTINNEKTRVTHGQVIVMPANIPHAVFAETKMKMMLTVVKKPVGIGRL